MVNLTKHIQLKVLQDMNEEQSEPTTADHASDLDSILPNFLWVVRDFSLQLEDEKGNEISAGDYLENALS